MSALAYGEPHLHLAAALLLRRKQTARTSPFHILPQYPKQAAIIEDPARFTMTEATTKAGKTFSHLEWLLDGACSIGEGEHWWVAPVYAQAEMAFRRACDRLRGFIQAPLPTGGFALQRVADPIPFSKNETNLLIQVCGARVQFRSAEKPDNLYGDDVRRAVLDEVSRMREAAWHAIYSTLTATKGIAKLIGNVKGRQNFAWRLARKAEAGEPDWSYHKLTANDAVAGGILDPAIIEQAKRDLPDDVFRQLYMAEAADDEGNPFGFDHIAACTQPLSEFNPAVWGWDLAKSQDWTVGVGLDRFGHVCRFHRFQHDWKNTRAEIQLKASGAPNVIDSTGNGDTSVEDLQRVMDVEGYVFTPKSKQILMEGLRNALQNREISVIDGVMRAEMEAFEYEYTAHGVRYSAPEGMHDDAVCALALAVYGYRNHRGLRLEDLIGDGILAEDLDPWEAAL